MSVQEQSDLSRILQPPSREFLETLRRVSSEEAGDGSFRLDEDGTMTLSIPTVILDKPTLYETHPNSSFTQMQKTRGFRAYYRASEKLAAFGSRPSLSYEELGSIFVARALLTYAKDEADSDPRATPELSMRIQLCEAMADITAFTGTIIENHDQPRMLESYEKLFFSDAYEKLLDVARELVQKYHEAGSSSERRRYSGLAHELAFHLLQYRQKSAMRFSTAASVYDDYFRPDNKFDAKAYNLKLGREKAVDVQIKTYPEQHEQDRDSVLKVIYGTTDLHNTKHDRFWNNTLQAGQELPTLLALLYEAAGNTTSSDKLDEITARLHSRLFS